MTRTKKSQNNGANLGFEEKLWTAADKMRGHMDPSEYKHVALGLVFLKYISDAFEERQKLLEKETANPESEFYVKEPTARYQVTEDRDEYLAENVFWVPKKARWSNLQANAKQPTIGKLIDDAMVAIEKDNPSLKGVLPKDYSRPSLDKYRLGELVDLIGTIGLGDAENRSKDIIGRVYEYFLSKFASAEGKKGGEFYTPRCVVRLLVEMMEPYKGRVYDPCCGSAGMFVQSEEFILQHGGKLGDIAIYGQESNPTTWKLAKMNLAIRGIEGDLGPHHADTFRNDLHKDLRTDFILANPPFNDDEWWSNKLENDVRWKHGVPPEGNANYAWIQHFVHHLAPNGVAGFVLANGSMSTATSNQGEIRSAIIDSDLIDCIVALPGQLFYGTPIPACLWFMTKDKQNNKFKDRRSQILFIDARKMGSLVDRTHRELSDEEIQKIANTYHAWRGEKEAGEYTDIAGYCKSAGLDEIKENGFVLTPGRYVGIEEPREDGEPFEEKMKRLTEQLEEQFTESTKLQRLITSNLEDIGYGK